MSLLRRLFCSHAFIERGTFKRNGKWWVTLVCGKCNALKRESVLPVSRETRIKQPYRLVCLEPADESIDDFFQRVRETRER